MRSRHRRRRPPALEPVPLTPRGAALDLLREKISAGQAGLDPYDPAVFVLDARDTERVWARRALELCGLILDHTTGGRFRAILEADVRMELGLDTAGRALMGDEPLASRAVTASEGEPQAGTAADRGLRLVDVSAPASPSATSHADRLMDATLAALEPPQPTAITALLDAKAAYDRRSKR